MYGIYANIWGILMDPMGKPLRHSALWICQGSSLWWPRNSPQARHGAECPWVAGFICVRLKLGTPKSYG